MQGKLTKVFGLFLSAAFLFGCFGGVDQRGSVLNYKNDVVLTKGGKFRIGPLSKDWRRKHFKYRSLLFMHKDYSASIHVSSFCKGSFDDAPISVLANQLFYGMTDQHQFSTENIFLSGREAHRDIRSGKLDGARIWLDTVVLKMNECVFDFAYVAMPDDYPLLVNDFETMLKGFQYLQGPPLD